jgi:crotonobetainyl-CoA:carnitine CoA-transferase CaiB-like acyl-CoA transferase
LLKGLEQIFASRPTEHWLSLLGAAGVPCAPVNDIADALEDPQTTARDVVHEVDHPVLGRIRGIGSPFYVDGARPRVRLAPAFGADTIDVLKDVCGYTEESIEELQRSGVLGEARVTA